MQQDLRSDGFGRGENWDNENNMNPRGAAGAGQGIDNTWDDTSPRSDRQGGGGKPSMGDRLKGLWSVPVLSTDLIESSCRRSGKGGGEGHAKPRSCRARPREKGSFSLLSLGDLSCIIKSASYAGGPV